MRGVGRGLQLTGLVLLPVGLLYGIEGGPDAMALEIGFLVAGVVDTALDPDVGRRRRHHGDQVEIGTAPLGDVAAVEQCLLARFGTVVSEQDALVHG